MLGSRIIGTGSSTQKNEPMYLSPMIQIPRVKILSIKSLKKRIEIIDLVIGKFIDILN